LNVVGLGGFAAKLPGGVRKGYEDLTWMVKKNWLLYRALRRVPANETVVAVDAFDVLFQRPLSALVATYRRLAEPSAHATGVWPVIFGGEANCWPFPHDASIPVRMTSGSRSPGGAGDWVHKIREESALSAGHVPHLGAQRFPFGDQSPWSIRGDQFCSEWLSLHYARVGADPRSEESMAWAYQRFPYPFLCSGTAVGIASTLRQLLRAFLAVHVERGEYDDQAILAQILLRNRSLGLVDAGAEISLQLHGHDDANLDRALCLPGYFEADIVGQDDGRLARLRPPALLSAGGAVPALLHFNGNGKIHMHRCAKYFRAEGLLGPPVEGEDGATVCTFFDHDRQDWTQMWQSTEGPNP